MSLFLMHKARKVQVVLQVQQVQRVHPGCGLELRAYQVQVARGRADVPMPEQAADGVQVHPAFEQVGGKAVTQGVCAAHLHDARLVPGSLVDALHVVAAERLARAGVDK